MKNYRALVVPRLLTVVVACGVTHAAEPERTQGEPAMPRPVARFIPAEFVRAESESSVNLLEDLEPLINSLNALTPEASKVRESSYEGKPRRGLERIIETTLSENQEMIRLSQIQIRVRSYPSFKETEEGYENTAALIQAHLKEGSPALRRIGEMSHYSSKRGDSTYIVFLRRNVVASTWCSGPMEILKNAKNRTTKRLDDAKSAENCERLAERIDELIVGLTNK
jgi:hypothetical protein